MGGIVSKCPKCQKLIPLNRLGTITALIFPLNECRCKPDGVTRRNSRSKAQSVRRTGDEDCVGKVIDDQYRIISHIGSGGMGAVYRAVDQNTNTEYALKFIAQGLADQEHLVKRLEHEARAAKGLSHPHIVPVYDIGKGSTGSPYLIMGYETGESLEDVLDSEGFLKSGRATNIFTQIADALVHAHEKGIVHRDLKPSNVLLTKKENVDDFVKLVDFGIAKIADEYNADKTKLTQTGELVGSPLYMSPEQCRGDELDARSDLYSFGCMMYEAVSGRPPFDGENPVRIILQQISAEPAQLPAKSDVNPDLVQVIMRCLEKDPKDRYQSAEPLLKDLENIRDGKPISRWKRKRKKGQFSNVAALVAALVLSGGGLMAFLFFSKGHEQPPAAVAPPQAQQYRTEEYNGRNLLQLTDEIEKSPDDPYLYFDRGYLHSLRDERTNAIDDFSQAIALKPTFMNAYLERSHLYVMIADYDKAIADANKALKIDPTSGDALLARGEIFAATERYKEACDDLTKAIAINGNAQAYVLLGRQYVKLADYKNAEHALRKALPGFSGNPSYVNCLLGLTAIFKQDLKTADSYFSKLNTEESALASNWGELAYYYVVTGNMPKAEQAIDQMKALETFPARSYRLAGEVYRTAGLQEKAIKEFSASTSLEEYPPGYRQRAMAYIELNELRAAKSDLEKSLKLNPYSTPTLSYLAIVESRMGMHAEAKDHIAKAFAPGNVQPPIVYANKAATELNNGDASAALKSANQALSLDPWLKEGYSIRAQIYDSLKDAGAASADRDKAAKLFSHLDL